jgi:hypothetical protein
MSSIKNIAFKLAPTLFSRLSSSGLGDDYSPKVEEFILRRIFDKKQKGIYTDLRVYYPFQASKSYLFHKQNCTCINIDPMQGSKALVNKHRSKDINLEICVSAIRQQHTYFIFNKQPLNTK